MIKNLSLFLNLGLVTMMSTFVPVNAQMNTETSDDTQTNSIVELQDKSSLECRVNNDANRNQTIQDETVAAPTYEVAVVGTNCPEYPATSGGSTNSGDTTIDNAIDGNSSK